MTYHHLAHFDKFERFIKKGVKIKRGDTIGTVGNSGTTYAHLHYEIMRSKPDRWTQYVYTDTGPLTKEQVEARYHEPSKWIDKKAEIPARYTTYGGWEWLDVINRSGTAFHPGVDINDKYGNQDLGNLIKSPCTGEVVYVARNEGGWGNHLWICEAEEDEHPQIDMGFAMKHAGKFFLQVQENGELWYITPNGQKVFVGKTPEEMLRFVESRAIGITNEDLKKFPTN